MKKYFFENWPKTAAAYAHPREISRRPKRQQREDNFWSPLMHRSCALLVLLCATSLVALHSGSVVAAQYMITDLGTLGGSFHSAFSSSILCSTALRSWSGSGTA